jgi:glycosyltransferase involved in cell wall biosynthesis
MQLVLLSTYPPRRCGLATFSADLLAGLRASVPDWRVDVCAIDRSVAGGDGATARPRYGPEVTVRLEQDDRADYRRAARAVVASGADLVVIQHEFGIFGGPNGCYLLEFTDELAAHGIPYAITLHTVLAAPTVGQAGVLARLCRGAAQVTVFTGTAREVAIASGVVDPDRLAVVPHGVPPVLVRPAETRPAETRLAGVQAAGIRPAVAEALAAVAGYRVLSTFGLIRPGKGLETVIEALPEVVSRHPDVRYLVAGATHPEVVRRSGESYRTGLAELAGRLGVAGHVRFVDSFLTEPELAALLHRSELHLTPYRTPEQTCSGVLTFALAAGCAVVSTSYRYAVDLVTPPDAPPRGVLVPFDDPAAFAAAVGDLLADPVRLAATRAAARQAGAELSWPVVGRRFAAVFSAAAVFSDATAFSDAAPPDRALTRVRSAVRIRTARLLERVADVRVATTVTAGGEPAWPGSQPPPVPASPAP